MKASLAIAALILLAAALFGWRQHESLSVLREEHRRLVAEAAALGVYADDADGVGRDAGSAGRHGRATRDDEARQFARDAAAFARDMKARQESGEEVDEPMRKRIFELLDRMLGLDAQQLKVVIAAIRADAGLDDESRRNLLGFSITMLANDHPQVALALFDESRDMLGDDNIRRHLVPNCLSQWAARDPLAALEWLRKRGSDPELASDEVHRAIVRGAARQDPALAFQLAGELGLKDPAGAGREIAQAARTAAERTAVLTALRGQDGAAAADEQAGKLRGAVLGTLAAGLAEDGFDAATTWLRDAALGPEESKALADGLGYWQTRDDTGRWIDWIGATLPAGSADAKVAQLVGNWTQADYQAAGAWLNGTTAATKPAAVKAYAQTVAPYDGATAARWALTMPAGAERDEVLRNVHAAWKEKDPDAAATFAREHGIGE